MRCDCVHTSPVPPPLCHVALRGFRIKEISVKDSRRASVTVASAGRKRFPRLRLMGYAGQFAASSIAPALAAIATNPIEVCKVKQQLEPRPGGLIATFRQIGAVHGLFGLQSGLQMSVVREASKSFFRIGLFLPILNSIHDKADGAAPIYKRLAAGMSSGAIAALVCNPIELVKTRQQAAGAGLSSFKYNGPLDGLLQLHASEGMAGMWRGTQVSMLRSAMVTGPHLTTYTAVKEGFSERGWMADAPPLHMLASLSGAFAGICCNQPLDVIRNKLYNQPLSKDGKTGRLYSGALHCAQLVWRSEGVGGFYRGFMSHYMRVGPHYVLTFTILEQIKPRLVAVLG